MIKYHGRGQYRRVYLSDHYAFKLAFTPIGIFSNLSEFITYLFAGKKLKNMLATTYISLGFLNVQDKCYYIADNKRRAIAKKICRLYGDIALSDDPKFSNFGRSNRTGKCVKLDYANHWFFSNLLWSIKMRYRMFKIRLLVLSSYKFDEYEFDKDKR